MLKKIFYIGLGFSIFAIKKSVSFLKEKGEQTEEQIIAVMDADASVVKSEPAEQPQTQGVAEGSLQRKKRTVKKAGDDLTEINGIGPTYAKRLRDAGITTFEALSKCSPEELRAVTKATGKAANPEAWIIQATHLT
jgi:predicted flap endonuclease-1-like 5' DNA nuclease